MLKIENSNFMEKFTEINIRQRLYNKENFITLNISTEFYPSLVNDSIISGRVEIKLDINDIKSLNDLEGKEYKGDIGSATISVNNNGIWEYLTMDNFRVKILKRHGRLLDFEFESDNCLLNTSGVMVSLYTTSSSREVLEDNFDLSDFYDNSINKKIGNNEVFKYFVKE